MSPSVLDPEQRQDRWHWPVDPTAYDRHPDLHASERAALATWMAHPPPSGQPWIAPPLPRLVTPLTDTLAAFGISYPGQRDAIEVLAREMHRRGTAYWAWTADQWQESLAGTVSAFGQRYGWHYKPYVARTTLCLVAYVLWRLHDLGGGRAHGPAPLARAQGLRHGRTQCDDGAGDRGALWVGLHLQALPPPALGAVLRAPAQSQPAVGGPHDGAARRHPAPDSEQEAPRHPLQGRAGARGPRPEHTAPRPCGPSAAGKSAMRASPRSGRVGACAGCTTPPCAAPGGFTTPC